jgi:ABC-type branched-subunit amino acid transport system permease subunit
VRGLITMIPGIGTETHTLPVPYRPGDASLGGAHQPSRWSSSACTAVLCLVLYAMFRYSKIGIAMQAASQNQLAAYYMGIPVQRLNGLVWGLAAAVAAIAGLLLAPITFVHANMGFIGLKAFPAAVVGGFGSLPGAIVGGLIIGLVEALSGFYLPEGFKDIAAYVVVLIMLVVKPNGLFGETHAQEGLTHAFHLQDLTSRTSTCQAQRPALLVRRCWAGPAGRALVAGVLAGAADLRADLRGGRPGPDAAGRLHRPGLHRPRRLPGRGRLHQAVLTAWAGRSRWPWPLAAGAVRRGRRAVVGLPALRVKGIYLGIATLAFGFIVEEVLARWESVTGGNAGMQRVSPVLRLATSQRRGKVLLPVPGVCAWITLGVLNLLRSPTGRAFVAIRDSEISAQSMGIHLAGYKTLAFAISAALAGLAGALYAHKMRFISPDQFGIVQSIDLLLMVVMGGLGFGARRLPGRDLPDRHAAADRAGQGLPAAGHRPGRRPAGGGYGVVLIAFVLFEPHGPVRPLAEGAHLLAAVPVLPQGHVQAAEVFQKSERLK